MKMGVCVQGGGGGRGVFLMGSEMGWRHGTRDGVVGDLSVSRLVNLIAVGCKLR